MDVSTLANVHDRGVDVRFLKGSVQFGNCVYANTAVLVGYLSKRIAVMFDPPATRNEVEGQLRNWLHPHDQNHEGLPWDIPALAEAVRRVGAGAEKEKESE